MEGCGMTVFGANGTMFPGSGIDEVAVARELWMVVERALLPAVELRDNAEAVGDAFRLGIARDVVEELYDEYGEIDDWLCFPGDYRLC
jgi:hypothetical protein